MTESGMESLNANLLKSEIREGNADTLKQLTKALYNDASLRDSWASSSGLWKAVAERIEKETNGNNSLEALNSTDATIATLQLANNLAATKNGTSQALKSGFLRSLLSSEFATSLHRYVYQILANVSCGFDVDMQPAIEELMVTDLDLSSMEFYDISDEPSTAFPISFLHRNILRTFTNVNDMLAEKSLILWDSILREVPKWLRHPESHTAVLNEIMQIAAMCFSDGFYPRLANTFGEPNEHGYIFFKLFASVIEGISTNNDEMEKIKSSFTLERSISMVANTLCNNLKAFSDELNRGKQAEVLFLGLTLIEQLRFFAGLSKMLPEIVPRYRQSSLYPLVQTLLASRNIPAKTKLGVPKDTKSDIGKNHRPEDFPYLKCFLLTLITDFVLDDKASQDYMRVSGGLAVVLECCIIDENNPFMKEHAILCVKYLLENNSENQDFVAKLEAKQAVNPVDSENAGYETEIVDGKINIKRSR